MNAPREKVRRGAVCGKCHQHFYPDVAKSESSKFNDQGLLLAQSEETVCADCQRGFVTKRLRYSIKHLMYLTLWTALIMAARDPLIASVPEIVTMIYWLTGIGAAGSFVALYVIAIIVEEGHQKERLIDRCCYLLIGDGILFFLFSIATHNIKT